jgi:Fe-S-cluster containining protein
MSTHGCNGSKGICFGTAPEWKERFVTSENNNTREIATVSFTIEGADFQMRSQVTVPLGPVTLGDLLPFARALSDAVVSETCRRIEEVEGRVSCTKGCGACCNNFVVISEAEARLIRKVVERLSEPQRSVLRSRFDKAQAKLRAVGLLEKLRTADRWSDEDYRILVAAYFYQQIPCPFLEEESCSIYQERPIVCREYLVTSPPEHCSGLGSEGVQRVELSMRVFNAVARCQITPQGHFLERVVPLILALEWAEAHPDDSPSKAGPELLRELLALLSG